MDIKEVIRTRKSFRTFDGRELSQEDKDALAAYAQTIENPYGIPVSFVWLDAAQYKLSSPVINGEHFYVAVKVPKVPRCEEALGFSFEKLVLYAWSLGVGTTWIAGTMNRSRFEEAAQTGPDEFMMVVSPLGYPAAKQSFVDRRLRGSVRGDERLPFEQLFFEGDFATPLLDCDDAVKDALEAVRWYPSAANKQPCRVVKAGDAFHFYKKGSMGGANRPWDSQKIDMGIALCHFMSVAGGVLSIADPGIAADAEYIATVTI
ncbi:MAG: hypothetical protein IJH83_04905 [Coriobacteriales bacterium]|nr:hypothetical protein [Coriobacteriales bacterium]